MTLSSITDKPISSNSENCLGIEGYSNALVDFLKDSATPLTIGVQGEWGTGKTSLMNMIKEILEKENIACSWVNTWEYSMFKTSRETVTSVLKGLLENLIYYCKTNNYWPREKDWEEKKAKLFKGLKKVAEFTANVAVQKTVGMSANFSLDDPECLVSEISLVKKEIQNVINLIVQSEVNPIEKVIFFVDDLDRIEPAVAVEILESLKNIFDIDNCVFILAIDYDVVVKGLEHKYGKKTTENEREFRSFFDKIIQVPFAMPTSEYDIEKLVLDRFVSLGFKIDPSIQKDIVQVIRLSVGYVPRSIKRLINTYSLLRRIRLIKNHDRSDDPQQDLLLFMLLSVQITYPLLYRIINKKYEYTKWDKLFAKAIEADLSLLEDIDKENEYLDEEWEQIVWAFCQKETYMKARALSVVELMNIPRSKFKNDDDFLDMLGDTMQFTSMTSVDDSIEVAEKKKPRTEYDDFDSYCSTVLQEKFSPEILSLVKNLNNHILSFLNVKMKIFASSVKYALINNEEIDNFNKKVFIFFDIDHSAKKHLRVSIKNKSISNSSNDLNSNVNLIDFESWSKKVNLKLWKDNGVALYRLTELDKNVEKLIAYSYANIETES